MDEMRGGASTLHRVLLIVTHNEITQHVVALHPLRGFRFGWKTVPTFWRKCSNDGPKSMLTACGDWLMELTDDDVL